MAFSNECESLAKAQFGPECFDLVSVRPKCGPDGTPNRFKYVFLEFFLRVSLRGSCILLVQLCVCFRFCFCFCPVFLRPYFVSATDCFVKYTKLVLTLQNRGSFFVETNGSLEPITLIRTALHELTRKVKNLKP